MVKVTVVYLGKSNCGSVNVLIILPFMLFWSLFFCKVNQTCWIISPIRYGYYFVGGICGTLPRLLCVEVYPKKRVYIFFIKREGLVKSANRLDLINGVGHSGDRIDNWVYFQRSGRNVQGPNTYKLHLEISIISVTGTVVRGTSKNKEWC